MICPRGPLAEGLRILGGLRAFSGVRAPSRESEFE